MRYLIILIPACLLALAAPADSLFSDEDAEAGTLIAEKVTRFKPGDIITVLVREQIQATTSAGTNTKKESDVESTANAGDNTFLSSDPDDPEDGILDTNKLPNWQIEAENETRNTGSTTRTSQLTTTITCVVAEVFPNGNIRLRGEKAIMVNRDDSILVLDGLVRSRDVTSANTVLSTQMANVTLDLKGKGPLWNNQRRGLITRFLDWFSPF